MFTASEAIYRAQLVAHNRNGVYYLGAGNYLGHPDDPPWTPSPYGPASDCSGFAISYCYGIVRHRPGFNTGPWATVSDDVNPNSAIEDAQHKEELFQNVVSTEPGDLLCYPTIHLDGHVFIGHVGIVLEVPLGAKSYTDLLVAQCHGPNGRGPAVTIGSGAVWDHHDATWPKQEHRTCVVRVKGANTAG